MAPFSSESKKVDGEMSSETPSSAEEILPTRHTTFVSMPGPPRRKNRSDLVDKPMLSRRPSLSSASRQAEGFFSRNVHRWRRCTPVDPVIPTAADEEGAPVPRGAPLTIDAQKIFKALLPREESASSLTDSSKHIVFPEFDSLNAYFVPEEVAQDLWHKEVNRLLDIVKHPERPLRFPSQNYFKQGSEKGYQDLSRCAEVILTAFSLCLLDNECINVEYCSQLSSREKLSKLIQQARRGQTTSETCVVGSDPAKQTEEEESLDAIFCLIDYISAVLARLVSGTATGDYWLANLLAVLTKRITKIKILLMDMQAHIPIAVAAGEAALDKSHTSGKLDASALDDEEDCEEVQRIINANTKEGLTSAEDAEVASYCVNQNKFRLGINATFRYILLSLRFLDRSGLSATEYEICVVVYETGFEGFKALLFQDRDLEYSATSDLDTLNTAHSAFNILNQTVTNLRDEPITEYTCDLATSVQWAYADSSNISCAPSETNDIESFDLSRCEKQTLCLKSMEDIITIMVPLVATSPVLVANFTTFRTMIALTSDVKDRVRPFAESQFSAFFRMHTDQFDSNNRRRDVLRLSDAVKDGLFSRCSLMSSSDIKGLPVSQSAGHESKLSRKLRDLTWEMDTWIIDENSVTVEHGLYVWSVIIVALILVAGGLAIGFTVGQRIAGVDPFGVATYAWVLAAFIVLICKSVQVDNWTWSDFLHRKVRCRSVSELQAVAGINDQLIMAKLLHDERGGSVLKTRGPYNSVFLNRNADGFSIDRPLSTRTILLSGLTLLKVITPQGHALVCLDARRGTNLEVVEHQGMDSKEHLICEDISRLSHRLKKRAGSSDSLNQPIRLQLTRSKNLKWNRIQGIYNVMNTIFV